jgi:membrane protein implicated in regulation of membrane protease activity
MDEPENWRWIWLGATVVLALAELAVPGTFFLISFAFGALVACILAFFDVNVGIQWLVFAGASAVALGALVPIGRRISAKPGITGVGATRFEGRRGMVLRDIPSGPNGTGLVRVEREEWRAESADGIPIAEGTTVNVLRVDGTRLIVSPLEEPE